MKNYFLSSLGLAAFFCTGLIHADEMHDGTDTCGKSPRPSRLAVRHIEANGIGYNQGYSTVEGFFSPAETYNDKWIPFLDLRGHVFNNGQPAINAGLGLRYLTDSRVWGINAYYDYRKTHKRPYNQVGVGLETLGEIWDFRINGYFVAGKNRTGLYDAEFDHFEENSMIISAKDQRALSGFNAEVGGHVNYFENFPMYFAAGTYYLTRDGINAWGGQFRAAIDIYENLRLEGNTSYDIIYKWIGQGQLSLIVPFGQKHRVQSKSGQTCKQAELMAHRAVQKVDRFEIIATADKHYKEVATYPNGNPITFYFVDNTSNCTGCYESPFDDIYEAFDEAGEGDVIYIFKGDGTNTGLELSYPFITLPDELQLLGAGVDHEFSTQFGPIVVNAQGEGFPFITYSDTGLFIGNGNTISGLRFTLDGTSAYDLINGLEVEDVKITRNIFDGVVVQDLGIINLDDVYGEINILGNSFMGVAGSAFYLYNQNDDLATLNFHGNSVTGLDSGLEIYLENGTQLDTSIHENSVNTSSWPIYASVEDNGTTLTGHVRHSDFLSYNEGGIRINNNAAFVDFEISDNIILNYGQEAGVFGSGIYYNQYDNIVGDADSSLKISYNSIVSQDDAIQTYVDGSYSHLHLSVEDNALVSHNDGMEIGASNSGYIGLSIARNEINGGDDGIYLYTNTEGYLEGSIEDNDVYADNDGVRFEIYDQGTLSLAEFSGNDIAATTYGIQSDTQTGGVVTVARAYGNEVASVDYALYFDMQTEYDEYSIGAEQYWTIESSIFTATGESAIYAHTISNSTLEVSLIGNQIASSYSIVDGSEYAALWIESEDTSAQTWTIDGNELAGMQYGLDIDAYDSSDVNINFSNNNVGSPDAGISLDLANGAEGVFVATNNIIGAGGDVLSFILQTTNDSYIELLGNYIESYGNASEFTDTSPAITVQNLDSGVVNLTIQGNEIVSPQRGISIQADSGFVCANIDDNIITSRTSPLSLSALHDATLLMTNNTINSMDPVVVTADDVEREVVVCVRWNDNFMHAETEFNILESCSTTEARIDLEEPVGNTPSTYSGTVTEVAPGTCPNCFTSPL